MVVQESEKVEEIILQESVLEKKPKSEILSIVIPTFNSSKLLSFCLEALENQSASKSEFEVTIVDDGSSDETAEMLSRFKVNSKLNLQWTTIINSGPGKARNAGVAISSGSWIGFVDADVIPHPRWVENAIELIHKKPYAGAFEGRTEVVPCRKITPFTHQTENLDGGRYPTCNFLVRRSLAHFYPAYQIPFREDTDLAFSILESGFQIIFAPEMIVTHPPLAPRYSRPISLARRYYYDGLLARRFPSRYKFELDAHRIVGLKIPHLKRKLYAFLAFSQISFIGELISKFDRDRIFLFFLIYFLGLVFSATASLRHSKLRDLSLQDWLVFLPILNILPWVMGFSLFRGWFYFRGEPAFSKR